MSMVQITRKIGDQIYLIELQATVEKVSETFDIGTLEIIQENNKKKAAIYVGNQCMEGVVETLQKPLAVLQKSHVGNDSLPIQELNIVSFIKEKIRFSSRPLPVKI
ncbi:DNA replication factor C complex subunit Ctf8 [Schizosaccharomyces cryophilus OY26]|uniref:DNA replication factor C complex subunit Ctf8 n=1 Tax=Schizosaccharomyces cryophilus (strain OY26 / ATCC MYA-4695 / CBS 11777 / NBRC 106824 / NRRL Y48691) TaxID=653667 RepID=S9WZQ1_SCHCR|nr:DNA replication factor C complex subunit Ctf8 [Schizosaccharomyces cryophilus OY26]EPY50202.1 DNA replication factor C complex subunit Ctf8 [Schizosaccharomyces cryophilus OY26]